MSATIGKWSIVNEPVNNRTVIAYSVLTIFLEIVAVLSHSVACLRIAAEQMQCAEIQSVTININSYPYNQHVVYELSNRYRNAKERAQIIILN
jgi:hypothetical protein